MPKALPQSVRDNIEKCRAATVAAVDVYNRPGPRFRTAHYIILIVLAWTGSWRIMGIGDEQKTHPGITPGDRQRRRSGKGKVVSLIAAPKQRTSRRIPPTDRIPAGGNRVFLQRR